MPSFEKAPKAVQEMADELLTEFETHKPLIEAGVSVTYMMAYPNLDENGIPIEDALTKGGMKCLGLCRKNSTRQRSEGLADCTITLDGPHWEDASREVKRALLDHELHHISVALEGHNSEGDAIYKRDNSGRPVIKLRKHDIEVGWFKLIAERHGQHSQERIQATEILVGHGQIFFPSIVNEIGAGRFQNLQTVSVRS